MKKTAFIVLLLLLCGSTLGISIEFRNKTDHVLVVHTAQYGGTPQLHEESNLTRTVEIKKQSSARIFLDATGPWLRWEAKSKEGKPVAAGTISLNPIAGRHHAIDISLPVTPHEEQDPEKN